jgi:NADH dehydrogenase [ubiquinone] 1 alpha subcomplex assembly factor 7
LQYPDYGYYRRRNPIGREGDFITAPEISQMFGEMIGLWCADVWRQMGQPDKFVLVELGPGRGTLMQDALRATAKVPGFHQALQLYLLESSETLRKIQQEKLVEHLPIYIDDLTQLPDLPLIVMANEFFDALPIRQFEKTFQGWCERMVTVDKNQLGFTLRPLDAMLLQLIPENLREANPGVFFEVSMPSTAILRHLAKHIARNGGAALIIDYGFTEPSGQPTLQAVSKHQYTDVLDDPGEVDLTAHVDFSLLKTVASGQGTIVWGPMGQGEFLQNLGIALRAAQLKQHADQANAIDTALKRLTDPTEMGNLFKVLAVTSSRINSVAGF